MPARLFLFVQFEFPWELGPPDGRYLLRAPGSDEPQHVVVLATLGASRRTAAGRGPARTRRRAVPVPPTQEPTAVPVARVTIVDPVSLSAEPQAKAWLEDFDTDRDVGAAAAVLNRVLYLHRIACADPYIHEVSPAQALAIRAGWGEGEQVADGHWLHALELPTVGAQGTKAGRWPGGRRYSAALRSGERLAQLLGGRAEPLACEELTLRARLDLDQGRLRHAAVELAGAFAAALPELRAEAKEELSVRLAELEELCPGVVIQHRAAQARDSEDPSEEVVRHALERLEATLRARTAGGLG